MAEYIDVMIDGPDQYVEVEVWNCYVSYANGLIHFAEGIRFEQQVTLILINDPNAEELI